MNGIPHNGATVEITSLHDLPDRIREKDLGMRMLHTKGFFDRFVPGFDSEAYRINHCDDFGELNGSWGIYFPGEFTVIPDLSN